ncbi:apyrase [Sporobolomyces salmoneus]|uniref:apyrase n=1 Tax=Sporobolomyces salmoneus TaxID=183962 RepID=UPI00316D51F0
MSPRPPAWSQGRKYGVVIDAGSSGSRIQVYSWVDPEIAKKDRKGKGLSTDVLSRIEKGVEEGDGWHLKVEPGISTFGDNPEDVAEYLKPLIEFAASVIPADQLPSTPIYLLATAGMRLLPPNQQAAVLSSACSYMQSFPFHLPSCSEQVRIISGEEEGLYGWIAVNYLMDGFDKHEHALDGERRKHSSTYGFLDMGGASTQIAFEPSDVEQVRHADNLLEVKMRLLSGKDVRHPVFVTTWLGFGTNQARNRYVDQEIRSHLRASDEEHPNLPPGDADGLGTERPVVLVDDPCLPKDLLLSEARHAGYTLRGTGDFLSCVRKTGPLLNKEVKCLDEPCLFNGVHVPPIDFSVNHFIGISEYWYSTQDVWGPSNGGGGVYDFVEFEKNAIEFCGKDWNEIMSDFKEGRGKWRSGVELSRLETQCFKAAWVVNILHEGIGIPRIIDRGGKGDGKNQTEKGLEKAIDKGLVDEPPSFQSLNEVHDVAISWTLGKMVLEVSQGSTQLPLLQPPTQDYPSSSSSSYPSDPKSSSESSHRYPSLDSLSGHIPSFNSGLRSTLSSIKDSEALPYGALVILAFIIYLFALSPAASRRRKSFCGVCCNNVFPGGRGGRRGSDFLPLSQHDDSMDSSVTAGGAGGSSRHPSAIMNLFVAPIRYVGWRASSTVRSWTRSITSRTGGSRPILPRSFSATQLNPLPRSTSDPELYRPRPLRPSKSTPFLRGLNTSSATTPSSTTAHWNDAPDLPFRQNPTPSSPQRTESKSLAPIARSQSSTGLAFQSSASSSSVPRSASPAPAMNVIPPSPHSLSISRPTTPSSARSISGLSKLTPRTTHSREANKGSIDFEISRLSPHPVSSVVSSPTSAVSPLASAVWDSLAREHPVTTPTAGGGGGGAKLRSSRSANNSQSNLASGYFANASSTNLGNSGGGDGT